MIRIDVLPDDVLLETFDFCVDPLSERKKDIEAWQSLVHVCRRWRSLVFGSPRRLNLRLSCTPKTPARNTLDVWPALPLLIGGDMSSSGADDIIVVLEQSNRVCQVNLWGLADRELEKVLGAMQVPFPELTKLQLFSGGETPPVVPDSFLGGSAPRLQYLELCGIPFPGLPKLLLSATHLLHLDISNISHSGYFSPEAMATLLSGLSSLKSLVLQFLSCPDWESRRPPPSERSVIPALEHFDFIGDIEYLEDLVTFIDAPRLVDFSVTFFDQTDFDANFDGPRLAQFIGRTPILADCGVHLIFYTTSALVLLRSLRKESESAITISYGEPDRLLSSIAQVCNTCLPPLSMIEDLYIHHPNLQRDWTNGAIGNTLWLELLLLFPVVKNLYLYRAPDIAAVLQETVGTEVLPSLQNIFVEGLKPSGPIRENIGQFVAAREPSGHSITISDWDGQ